MVLAAFFGTFLLFLALGLLALAVTAVLDRSIGKERALLVWAVVVVGVAWLLRPQAPPRVTPRTQDLAVSPATLDPAAPLRFGGELLARPALPKLDRNPFREHSDTSPLPPVDVSPPPDVPLAFPLPPTVPGAGPAAGRLYRGVLPAVATGDGSALPAIPVDGFSTYQSKPEDVFDWIVRGGKRWYVYLLAIDGVREGDPAFEGPRGLKWNLALNEGPPNYTREWDKLQITFAMIGPEEVAQKVVDDVGKAKKTGVVTGTGKDNDRWFLRRSVDNLYVEALRAQGNPNPEALSVEQLRAAAAEMARVGETGKEDRAGYARAVTLLETALAKVRQRAGADALEGDLLVALVEAHRALNDERAMLAALAAYARQNPREGDAPASIGEVFVRGLALPEAALAFLDHAVSLEPGLRAAHLSRGDALTLLGDHAAAQKAYAEAARARAGPDASVREAEALLRLGRPAEARRAVDQALAAAAFDPRGLLAKGAAQYATGDVAGARDTFAQAATLPGAGVAGLPARRHRAEALYDLGLAEWRLGHGDAARAAFDACEAALRSGSQPGRSAGEAISPELGRALLSLSAGNAAEAADALGRAREQAPGLAYVELLSGVMAMGAAVPAAPATPPAETPAGAGGDAAPGGASASPAPETADAPAARRAFERALALEPDLHEVDAWLAAARLSVAEAAVAAGVPPAESGADFDAAIRFAERASLRERAADPKNPDFLVREAAVRLRARHQSEKGRFEAARRTADAVLSGIAREDRRALAIKGYCNYRLGVYDAELYDHCIRNLQQVVDLSVNTNDALRAYAVDALDRVKKWQALEIRTISFGDTKLSTDWEQDQSKGVRGAPDGDRLRFWDSDRAKGASQDGSLDEPTVRVRSDKLFDKSTFEKMTVVLYVPKTDRQGQAINNVTFGVQVQAPSRPTGLSRVQGVGVFFDKGKVAVRAGGSNDAARKDGQVHRVREMDWPDTDAGKGVVVEFERTDPKDGEVVVRIYPEGAREDQKVEILRERLPAFRSARGAMEVWFGGYSTKSQNWDVAADDLRIVRRKS